MNVRRAVTGLVLGVAALLCASCSQQRICNGPAEQPPMLLLDGGDWAAAHPSAQLTACLAAACTVAASGAALAAPAGQPIEVVLPATGNPRLPVQLSITATDAGRELIKISTTVTLKETDETGACGTVQQWRTSAELTPTGKLRLK